MGRAERFGYGHGEREHATAATASASGAGAQGLVRTAYVLGRAGCVFRLRQERYSRRRASALTQDATAVKAILADFPNASIVIEGHCDERGSAEYNLGLGDRRASSAKEFLLVQLGVPADRLKTISYGKERPLCTDSNEYCWQRNRRVHFSAGQ